MNGLLQQVVNIIQLEQTDVHFLILGFVFPLHGIAAAVQCAVTW